VTKELSQWEFDGKALEPTLFSNERNKCSCEHIWFRSMVNTGLQVRSPLPISRRYLHTFLMTVGTARNSNNERWAHWE
jgi:hypothetical protein